MPKGGPKHFAKPAIDLGILLKILKNNSETVKNLGLYETISKTAAVNPKGLLKCKGLLQDFIEATPTCEVSSQALRTSLTHLLTHNVSVNTSKFNGATWANIKAERITVLLAHCRKVARDMEQQRLCTAKLTSTEYQELEAVFSQVVLKDEPDEPLKKGRVLKPNLSGASLDSDGMPNMFATPDKKSPKKEKSTAIVHKPSDTKWKRPGAMCKANPLEKRKEKEAKESESSGGKSDSLKRKMGYGSKTMKRPASKKDKPLKKEASSKKGKPLKKRQASNIDPHQTWTNLSVCNATYPERSYITGCQKGSTQRMLIVEVPAKWTKDYKGVIGKLKKAIEQGSTKAEALELRSKLVKQTKH